MSMLHEIGVELEAQLEARGCVFPVIDGPEFRPTVTFARERIVLEYDMTGTEGYLAKHNSKINPTARYTRNMACKATIYVKAPKPGALYMEHQRRAEHVLDQVIVGLQKVALPRQNIFLPTSGHFKLPDDLKESETPGGAVYELFFNFDRGIVDQNWNFSPDPTATIVAEQADPPVAGQVVISNSTTAVAPDGSTETV